MRMSEIVEVQHAVIAAGACGMSVTEVSGEGELKDYFKQDWLVTHGRIEVFTTMSHAEEIAKAIVNAAHTGQEGDGIVAVLPVAQIYRIRTQSEPTADELEGKRSSDSG